MPKIFVSYRRIDSEERAHRIADWLVLKYGEQNVFIDVDAIDGGEDFADAIISSLNESDVLLVVIGDKWVDELVRRTESDEADFVRLEVSKGLQDVSLVIPVLLHRQVQVDVNRLPEDIKNIVRRNFMYARLTDFHQDLERIRDKIDREFDQSINLQHQQTASRSIPFVPIIAGILILIIIIFGGLILPGMNRETVITPTSEQGAPEINNDLPPTLSEDNVRSTGIASAINTLTALAPTITGTLTLTSTDTPIPASDLQSTAQSTFIARTENALAQQFIVGSTATHNAQLSLTPIPTATYTLTVTLSHTPTATYTPTVTPSHTPTATYTPTVTPSHTPTATYTPTVTPSHTPTLSPLVLAQTHVTSNDQWEPFEQDFDGVTMVLVPVGQIEMGSTREQIDFAVQLCQQAADNGAECFHSWYQDESPNGDNTHIVTSPFWIDKFQVSRNQYLRCIRANVCSDTPDFPLHLVELDQPINRVTWFQAKTYCEWRDGALPTEAQWEYVARGPDGLLFPWGNDFAGDEVNHCDQNCGQQDWSSGHNYINQENNDGYATTAPVTAYSHNESWVGARNMSGNVWEWTDSLYMNYPYRDNRVPTENNTDARVLRGGSFGDAMDAQRSADRYFGVPDAEFAYIGFRCIQSS